MNKNKIKILLYHFYGCFILFFCLFFLFIIFVPVRLSVSFQTPLYADEDLNENNTTFFYESLFGIKYKANHLWYKQMDGVVTAYSSGFWLTSDIPSEKPVESKVTYNGNVYAGQTIDPSKLAVIMKYEDGSLRTVQNVSVTSDLVPMTSHCTIPVVTNAGLVSWETDVMTPVKLTASYDKSAMLGDVFDENKVIFELVYPDGNAEQNFNFSVENPPKYLSESMTLSIVSPYGETKLEIIPQNLQKLSVSYDESVYVGDVLSKDLVHVSMIKSDGSVSNITDFVFPETGVVKTDMDVVLATKFGNAYLHIEPIQVSSVTADYVTDPVSGGILDVGVVHLTYEDGIVRDVNVSDIQFIKDDLTLSDGIQTFWFEWNDLFYGLNVEPIDSNVIDVRNNRLSELNDIEFKTYELNQDQLSQIAVLCQRLGSDDPMTVAMEASLLANRYELYSDGSQNLADYMLHSGYWGEDAASYSTSYDPSDINLKIVEDVLIRGYRQLPLYVDEQAAVSDIKFQNSEDLEKNETELTKNDGSVFRYFMNSNDGSLMYGYTNSAFQKITGQILKTSNPENPVSISVDNDVDDDINFDISDETIESSDTVEDENVDQIEDDGIFIE